MGKKDAIDVKNKVNETQKLSKRKIESDIDKASFIISDHDITFPDNKMIIHKPKVP